MANSTPTIPNSEIDEFMRTCKSEADDSRRCRQMIGQLREQLKAKDDLLQKALTYVEAIEFLMNSQSPWTSLRINGHGTGLSDSIKQALKEGD